MRKSCVPNIFTFINLSFGILSIIETHNGNYRLASIFIIAAALVDRYDGRIARFLQVSTTDSALRQTSTTNTWKT